MILLWNLPADYRLPMPVKLILQNYMRTSQLSAKTNSRDVYTCQSIAPENPKFDNEQYKELAKEWRFGTTATQTETPRKCYPNNGDSLYFTVDSSSDNSTYFIFRRMCITWRKRIMCVGTSKFVHNFVQSDVLICARDSPEIAGKC